MEGTKNKISGIIILLIFIALQVSAQKKDLTYYQCAFFETYRLGDMTSWPALISEMEQVKSGNLAWKTEIVKAMYGLVGYQLGAKRKDLAKTYVDKADEYLDDLLDKYPNNAQLHGLDGAFYGYKIALSFYKVPFYGPKSMYHIEKSITLDPTEPTGYIEKGNSLLYRPATFGGDKKEALAYYRKALKLMEARNDLNCNWQHLLLRAFILKTLYETNQANEAKIFMTEMQKDYGSMNWIKEFVGASLIEGK